MCFKLFQIYYFNLKKRSVDFLTRISFLAHLKKTYTLFSRFTLKESLVNSKKMNKILLFLFCISSFSFAQKKHQIESITQINTINTISTTINYKFENGKLISIEEENKKPVYFTYNQKGLLEKESETYNDGEIHDTYYTYNAEGYLTEILKTVKKPDAENFKIWFKHTTTYTIKDAENYSILDVSSYTHTTKYINKNSYERKGNILNQSSNRGDYIYKLDKGNIIYLEKINDPLFNHSVDFKYDTKESIYKLIFENMYGDKYFINTLVRQPQLFNFYNEFVNQNNCVERKNDKTTEHSGVSEFTSKITYNASNLPTEIKIEGKKDYEHILTIKYKTPQIKSYKKTKKR